MHRATVIWAGTAGLAAALGLWALLPSSSVKAQPVASASQITQLGRAIAGSAVGQRRSRRRPRRMIYSESTVTNGGTIEGVVTYEGPAPPPRRIQIIKDTQHCGHRPTSIPQIEVNEQKQVANAVVFLGDIRKGKAIPPPKEKYRIDQKTCTFHPHVQALPVRQPLEVINSDPLLHNIHAIQGVREVFNRAQPNQGMVFDEEFTRGGLVTLKCQAHPWMLAYIYVLWHPYYQVTGPEGHFKLTDVPPGEYELVVWQEYLGEQSRSVKVKAGEATNVAFVLEPREP